jgi:hypothetical protein
MPALNRSGLLDAWSPMRGLFLIGGSAIASLGLILVGQPLLRQQQARVTPSLSPNALWQRYRWSTDPSQRREAALLLSSTIDDAQTPPRHSDRGSRPPPIGAICCAAFPEAPPAPMPATTSAPAIQACSNNSGSNSRPTPPLSTAPFVMAMASTSPVGLPTTRGQVR